MPSSTLPISASEVADATFLAGAAYSSSSNALVNTLFLSGWTALGAAELNLPATSFGLRLFDSNYMYDNLNAQAFVASRNGTLAI